MLYLFYGKPSYKVSGNTQKNWLMPICFLIQANELNSIKRIFPFDSGAFSAGRHPAYLSTFDIGEFEVSGLNDPSKIVGAFFKTIKDYFKLAPKDEGQFRTEHSLTVMDHEILALRDLAGDSSLNGIDDRRFCVEIQTEAKIDLTPRSVLAVILPYDYLEDSSVVEFIETDLEAVPLPYDCFSLTSAEHTAIIYSKVLEFLRREGGLNGV
ncbi:hypothetical protein [Poseidonocella sp. HB161398]|uniref:hypothetical protein n=1 Tax=Poseidonocella sp. HB161398 TaxID=2320855 RepID=UPI00148607E8|nr:hypothetical protein [Poseidonocella sp. HB161398]